MTTPLQAIEACYERVRTGWSASAFQLAAEHFTPPAAAPWIRVTVQSLGSGNATHGSTGNRYVQRRALLHAQCFAPHATTGADDGVGAATVLADTFRALFEGADVATVGGGTLSFEPGDVRTIGVAGKWVQVNASIPFTYEATF